MKLNRTLRIIGLSLAACALQARADVYFTDNFDAGASPAWGNQLGNWTTSGGGYFAQQPSGIPLTYSLLPFNLTDFSLDVDIRQVNEGAIYLRGDAAGHGVLLVIGGHGGTANSLYWHGQQSWGNPGTIINEAPNQWAEGDNIHLHLVAAGNNFSVFLNGALAPATTFTMSGYLNGQVGLIDTTFQKFDNFSLTIVPEPGALSIIGLGLLGLGVIRRRRK